MSGDECRTPQCGLGEVADRLRGERDELRTEVERLKARTPERCMVCAGEPSSTSKPCVCGGSGLAVDEVKNLRLLAMQADELRTLLRDLVASLPKCDGCEMPATHVHLPKGSREWCLACEPNPNRKQVIVFSCVGVHAAVDYLEKHK